MIQMSAAANSATPTNSLTRRETVDPPTVSDLHDDGEHERPPSGTLAEVAAQLDTQPLLDQALVGALFDARLRDHLGQQPGAVGEQGLAVFHHEAARDDVGHTF